MFANVQRGPRLKFAGLLPEQCLQYSINILAGTCTKEVLGIAPVRRSCRIYPNLGMARRLIARNIDDYKLLYLMCIVLLDLFRFFRGYKVVTTFEGMVRRSILCLTLCM